MSIVNKLLNAVSRLRREPNESLRALAERIYECNRAVHTAEFGPNPPGFPPFEQLDIDVRKGFFVLARMRPRA